MQPQGNKAHDNKKNSDEGHDGAHRHKKIEQVRQILHDHPGISAGSKKKAVEKQKPMKGRVQFLDSSRDISAHKEKIHVDRPNEYARLVHNAGNKMNWKAFAQLPKTDELVEDNEHNVDRNLSTSIPPPPSSPPPRLHPTQEESTEVRKRKNKFVPTGFFIIPTDSEPKLEAADKRISWGEYIYRITFASLIFFEMWLSHICLPLNFVSLPTHIVFGLPS